MSPSQSALPIPFDDEDSGSDPTPVVPTFSGLVSHSGQQEPLESLERYKLVARLGQGGMAEVFLAAWEIAPFVHRPVVIKRLHQHLTQDQSLVQMFLDEARLLCLLDHPHVVKTLEAGVIEGRCCIAMEYLQGQPLHRLLRRAYQLGALPVELAVSIGISVLDALHYAHDAKDASGQPLDIVHRDVSPHNVFVTNDGQVKILDFGIAKAKTHEGRTATGIVKGKVGYMAPEQAAAEAVDRRADVWSVGVVLWEALAGVRLFKAETDAATLNLILKCNIPSVRTRRPELAVELDAVLARSLQRTAALRYPSARAMQQELEHWLAAGHRRDPHSLAGLMHELFATEIVEQRRLVSALMARSDCMPPAPISNRAPSSTSALIVTRPSPTSADLTSVNERVDELNQRHRRAYRSLFAALLALFAGLAFGVSYLVLLKRSPSALPATPRAGMGSAPGLQRPIAAYASNASNASNANASAEPSPPLTPAPKPSTATHWRPAAAARTAGPVAEPRTVNASAREDANSGFGFLTIDTSPWSLVSVGGRLLGQTPLVGIKLPSGDHVLWLKNPELGIEMSYTVTIETGKIKARRIGIE